MNLTHVTVDETLKEKDSPSDHSFPAGLYSNDFHTFVNQEIRCHWHDKFEYGLVLSGSVLFYIDDKSYLLSPGEGIFVNANVLHRAVLPPGASNAVMFTVTFSDNIFPFFCQSYFEPVLLKNIQGFPLSDENLICQDILSVLQIIQTLNRDDFGFDLQCLSLLASLWRHTAFFITQENSSAFFIQHSEHCMERTLKMLSFIHDNYSQNISVRDIASSASVGVSECFRCFRKYTNKTPLEYTNDYRLDQAAALLLRTQFTISEVSLFCGFSNSSYFGKLFRLRYGITPLQYRKDKTADKPHYTV